MHTNNPAHNQPPQNILVVDDEAVIRDMMVDILDLEGYPIQVARNGQEALAVLSADPQAGFLIFLDLMMPVMDGYEFCRILNADPVHRQRHTIVLMSALDQLARAQSLQINETMPKPFVVDDIMRIIQTYMS
ncbi:response regulator [Dictyobacter alpinus]|uniref:Response regulator n=1 Tax=Dictyobacter alpinus TaxID=2014873 RepID=A0A402B529_9CHLR|nr:response regulator [Dictyobacter alpinus]GCE26445.1 response regulator [Dictyobacter alpinus]